MRLCRSLSEKKEGALAENFIDRFENDVVHGGWFKPVTIELRSFVRRFYGQGTQFQERDSRRDILSPQEHLLAAATQVQFQSTPGPGNRFSPEFEVLVACCKSSNRPALLSLLTSELDWDLVLESAQHHRVLPAVHATLARTDRQPPALRVRAHKHAWRILHFNVELTKIARRFDQHGIQFLAHKGLALAQLLYHDPAARQFGDLDFIVSSQDVPRAKAALMELGYEPGLHLSASQERSYLRSGYEYVFGLRAERNLVELQWQIVPRFCSIKFDIDAFFRRSIQIELDGLALRTLGHEDQMLVLCVHAAKHEWAQLGMLRDIAALMRFDLDWKWIIIEARRLGILTILQISLLAVRELFSVDLPVVLQSRPLVRDATELAHTVVTKLQKNREPATESLQYFRIQLKMRERLRDRGQFVWRLATTSGIEEWNSVRLPDRYFAFYRGVRIARLARRFLV
jgi:hypothetical protein